MSTKIGLILSLLFVSLFFFLGGDLISLQHIYSDLDSKGINISYLISKSGRVDNDFKNELEKRYNVNISIKTTTAPKFGDVVDYELSENFEPLIMSTDSLTIKVKKSAIIGYFG